MESSASTSSNAAVENDTFAALKRSICSKIFSRKDALTRHSIVHSGENFTCSVCGKVFSRNDHLIQHQKVHVPKSDKLFKCDQCEKAFFRKNHLKRHQKIHTLESDELFKCNQCDKEFVEKRELFHHLKVVHSTKPLVSVKRNSQTPNTASKRMKRKNEAFSTKTLYPEEGEEYDLDIFQTGLRSRLQEFLENAVREKLAIKWYTILHVSLIRKTSEGEIEETRPYLTHYPIMELIEETISDHINESFGKTKKSLEDFTQGGSGWVLNKILYLELMIAKYHPLAASSYIPLPKKLADKKAILNIQNDDNKCLIWCLLAHKMHIDRNNHPHRVSHYMPHEGEIKLGDVQLPVPVCKIPIIEKLNNLRINVFGFEEEVFPLYISPREDVDSINLLLISDGEQLHYCLIRNMSRLLGNLTKHKATSFYCFRCLHRFCREDLLKDHLNYCKQHVPQQIKLPQEKENILSFTGYHLQHPVAYTIYADFESLLVPISSSSPNPQESYTEKIHYHLPCGYAYVIVGPDGKSLKPISVYRGPNTVQHFLKKMMYEKEELGKKLTHIKPMELSSEQQTAFELAENCYLCKQPLNTDRVRDHDHLTGEYRGALHFKCNLKYRQSKTIPVIFHNLKHYDGHLIMQELGKYKDHQIDIIPSTMENYISFKIHKPQSSVQMVFLDSFQFLSASLEKLTKNLDFNEFNILRENFPSNTPFHLLTRKGIYPYEYMDSFEKFNETVLPPPDAFFNKLTEESISVDDYAHAQNIWNTFKI